MNTNQNDNSGQGNLGGQTGNQDSQRSQSGEQYAGNQSGRMENNDDQENQRLSTFPDGNTETARNSQDNEDRRLGERDFNSGNAQGGSNSQTGYSDEDRRASDSRNYGGDGTEESDNYLATDADDSDFEDEENNAADFNDDDDLIEDDLANDRPI